MQAHRQTPRARFVRQTLLAGALLAALAATAPAQAARVGHARMVSASGQPLAVELALREVAAEQAAVTSVSAAPGAAWREAGLTPPVALESLSFQVAPGPVAGTQTIRVRSDQAFHGDIADLLLEIRTAGGRLLHQVSVMAPDARSPIVSLASGSSAASGAAASAGGGSAGQTQDAIRVKRGDTLFSIARSHAVPGVSVYQMMMALQAVNPGAFIDGNVNRLKAGASLRLPDADELAVLSDAQARRLFREQGEAFAAYRDRIAGLRGAAAGADTAQGKVTPAASSAPEASPGQARDQLVLSGNAGKQDAQADDRLAGDKNIADSRERIAELEGNVQALNQAVGQGAGAASGAAANGAQTNAAAANGAAAQAGQTAASAAQDTAASATGATGGAASSLAEPGKGGMQAGQAATEPADSKLTQEAAPGAGQQKPWWQDNMLGIVTGLLALLVLLLVWWLRRAGVNRGTPITEDMVRQKLEQIDLDLDGSPDEAGRRNDGNSV